MRSVLDRTYELSGYLAGVFMIGTLLAILASIFGRLLAIEVPGSDAYAGYSMAAGAFLALAPTLRRGEHIRVTLLLSHLGARANRGVEIACHTAALLLSGALAWFSIRLVWQSHLFHDVSQSMDATPLWIPQIAMALGTVLLFVAFADDLLAHLRGSDPGLRHREVGATARLE
ncbi:MAG: TRAP transporter small permease [Burkholderiaceae bacterium]